MFPIEPEALPAIGTGKVNQTLRHGLPLLLALACLLAPVPALADADPRDLRDARESIRSYSRFTFVRISYDSEGGWGEAFYDYDGRIWQRWETDYPEAEENFLLRMVELTTCEPNPLPIVRKLTDDDLFRFPLIYMSDIGWMRLSREEIAALREYLLRGGMLWVDDFWGDAEWNTLASHMRRALPEFQWFDIPPGHPIFNVVFPLERCPQIPAQDFFEMGYQWDPPGVHRQPAGGDAGVRTVNFRGIADEDGRLMVVASHNTDLADGFEREGIDEAFFQLYSTQAYAMGMNIVVYALTH
jgi:hypothetical protein